jgi:hypothetical protein
VPCADAIDTIAVVPADLSAILDAVALPTRTTLQANPTNNSTPPLRLFAKQGLVVRTGSAVALSIGPGWEDRARIGWGSPGPRPAPRISVPACTGPSGGAVRWLSFAGGYYVDQPACLPLIVGVKGRQLQVFIGVGVACPGAVTTR